MHCNCQRCIKSREKCEWFEIGTVIKYDIFGDSTETRTVETFDTYEEAYKRKKELMLENPQTEYFIDGWINPDNPVDIWNEHE